MGRGSLTIPRRNEGKPISLRILADHEARPVQTVTARTGPLTLIVRRWSNGDGESCRLCSTCTFQPGQDGTGLCVVGTSGPVSADAAPAFGDLP